MTKYGEFTKKERELISRVDPKLGFKYKTIMGNHGNYLLIFNNTALVVNKNKSYIENVIINNKFYKRKSVKIVFSLTFSRVINHIIIKIDKANEGFRAEEFEIDIDTPQYKKYIYGQYDYKRNFENFSSLRQLALIKMLSC